MESLRPPRKATIFCLSRPDSGEPAHKTLLPDINHVLNNLFTSVSIEKGFSRPTEEGKDFIFIFCEGVRGSADEGDVKLLVEAVKEGCSKTFVNCSVQRDKDSINELGNVLLVLKMKGIDHVEIFSTFPKYQFTLA
jgi:hypothetical protein